MGQILFNMGSRRSHLNRSNGILLDLDCSDLTGWTDSDTGEAVSSQVTFDGKSCYKFDSVTSADTNDYASREKDVGSVEGLGTRVTVSINTYFDLVGVLAGTDYFYLVVPRSDWKLSIAFASDGLFVYDGASFNEVGTNLVQLDAWQEWSFDIDLSGGIASAVCDVYLDQSLVASSVDCSWMAADTDGLIRITQYGYATDNQITYLDWFKIGDAF